MEYLEPIPIRGKRNSIGPSTMPWSTPESTVVSFDYSPSTIVRIDLAVRKFVSHLKLNSFDIQHAIIDVLPGRISYLSGSGRIACKLFDRVRTNSPQAKKLVTEYYLHK
jgi:hypothetical protein